MRWLIGLALTVLLTTIAVTTTMAHLVSADQRPSATNARATAPTMTATSNSTASGIATTSVAPSSSVPSSPSTRQYTLADLSAHASTQTCWLLVSDRIYDVTGYLAKHPGGTRTVTPWCGKEATKAFATEDGRGEHSPEAYALLDDYYIGDLQR